MAVTIAAVTLTACGAKPDTDPEEAPQVSRSERGQTVAAESESPPDASPGATQAERAQAAAMQLGSRLKARLQAAIQGDGPVAAIEVCAVEAPQIAAEVSAASGFDVGRTALRVRNPANAPDEREAAVLDAWIASIDAGTPAAELDAHVEEGESFLWMKPIVTEPVCLMCHGKSLPEAVAAAIAERYPGDRATGFEAGDLRGAFTVRGANR